MVEGQKVLTEIEESGLEVVKVFSMGPLDKKITAPWSDISERELREISSLVAPNDVVALVWQDPRALSAAVSVGSQALMYQMNEPIIS